eukprot:TRINITY_DN13885_c0_g1_i1.p2 TRINITY_DN13885_c0_g1~~TRINITY_DN13885_c0_g1_i1.p2  ORF type:complete len:117 (-),score=42.04 TRINITY_DN13885_c0_g1_i1:19-369(-)
MKRGIAYERYGDNHSALEDFTAVVELDEEEWSDRARVHRARLHLSGDDRTKWWSGVEDCTTVLQRHPKDLAALKTRAELHGKLKLADKQAEDMRNYKIAERAYSWNIGSKAPPRQH